MRTRARVVTAVVGAVAVAAVGALVWWRLTADEPAPGATPTPTVTATASPSPTPTPSPTPSPAPAEPTTPEPAPTTPEPEPAPAPPAPASVEVVTTYAGWNSASGAVEVGAYAAAVERNGSCTLELTRGTASVAVTSLAEPDATSTSCGALAVAGTQLSPGTWQAVVRYSSPTSAGSSRPVTVEVP